MKTTIRFLLFGIILLLTGCAVKHAQNAQEFRQMAPANSYGKFETYNLDIPYSNAVSNIRSQADRCLNTKVVVTTRDKNTGAIMGEQTLTYTPTLKVGKAKSELSIQQNVSGDGMILGDVPDKGIFIFLADISDSGNGKSRLDIYRVTYMGTNQMVSAVKNWTSGENLNCPNLSQ